MNLDELLSTLKRLGATVGKSAIKKYTTEYELAEGPTFYWNGPKRGKKSDYSNESVGQIYAAAKLLNGKIQARRKTLKPVRDLAIELRKEEVLTIDDSFLEALDINTTDLAYLVELWINYCEEVKQKDVKFRVEIIPRLEDRQLKLTKAPVRKATRTAARRFKIGDD